MSDETDLKMFEIKAGLEEIKEEMERIKKENTDLKNNMAFNHLIEKVDDFQRNYSSRFEDIEEKLSTHCNNSDKILSEINETLRKQNKDIDTLKKDMKTRDKETILLLGGKSEDKLMDSSLILQNNGENDGSWTELNIKLPYAIQFHRAQFLSNDLYIFGGFHEEGEALNSTYKLTGGHKLLTNSLKWEKMANMNEKRYGISNSSVIVNYRIWAIGGHNGNNALKSVEMYDPQTNIWTNMKEMNECRSFAAAAVVGAKVFCCGGYNGYNFLKSAECYDPSSDVWTLISDMPGPNGACGVVVVNAHLIVIGGKAAIYKDFFNSVWVLDTTDKSAKWIEKEPRMSLARCQFSIAKIEDKIFVCGGCYIDEKDSKAYSTNNVEIFDGEKWKNGPKLTVPRRSAPTVTIPMKYVQYLN